MTQIEYFMETMEMKEQNNTKELANRRLAIQAKKMREKHLEMAAQLARSPNPRGRGGADFEREVDYVIDEIEEDEARSSREFAEVAACEAGSVWPIGQDPRDEGAGGVSSGRARRSEAGPKRDQREGAGNQCEGGRGGVCAAEVAGGGADAPVLF